VGPAKQTVLAGGTMGQTETPWYQDGLAFECTRCGACCTGAPGYVWVSVEEIEALARFRNEAIESFTQKFVRRVGNRYSLIEKPTGDCIFWSSERGCTVYPARPVQCQTWPFWSENIESAESWERVKQVCPGSGRGQWFSVEQVEAAAAKIRE
jgi:Fe-S-cluster containining protein